MYEELELLDKDLSRCFVGSSVPFQVPEIGWIAHHMFEALSALKQLGITHTDVKPENVMFVSCKDQTNENVPLEHTIQTLGYRTPEVILGLPGNEAIDTWSLGCVLSEKFLRKFLFPRKNKYDNLRSILKLLGRPDYKFLDKGILVPEYFTQGNSSFGHFWVFRSLYEYKSVNGKVYERADTDYNGARSLDKLEYAGEEEQENPSNFVPTKTRTTDTSGNIKQIKPTTEREKTPHPNPSKAPPNHGDLNESLSEEKMKETTSGKSFSGSQDS
uniref:Protein kinase domain-containing protein n=1 Tax=Nothobranchius furzeri TaxID=105023 RepID=A0A8C6MFQ1_NOTFU